MEYRTAREEMQELLFHKTNIAWMLEKENGTHIVFLLASMNDRLHWQPCKCEIPMGKQQRLP